MAVTEEPIPPFIDQSITFPNGETYDLSQPLTSYRSCHDGTPFEARMVFLCKKASDESSDEFVMKVKTQLPQEGQTPENGPSTTTSHELVALTKFRDAGIVSAPQLVAFHQRTQDEGGPLPGGYQTFTVMTKMPGHSLFGKFWNMTVEERAEIVPRATKALRSIYDLGIEPIDRGLRNVVWEPISKTCSIIDFELWHETDTTFTDEKAEMQRWGLVRTPPAKDHWAAWNQMYR